VIELPTRERGSFALLGHPSSYDHFCRLAASSGHLRKGERLLAHQRSITKMIEWMPAYVAPSPITLRLGNRILDGHLIICPFFPERLAHVGHLKVAYSKIESAFALAKAHSTRVLAMGGLTSILAGKMGRSMGDNPAMIVTAGNSLTAALAIEQLKTVLASRQRSLVGARVSIIGATGDIGRTCAMILSDLVDHLQLFARSRPRLLKLRDMLPNAHFCANLGDALSAPIIVTATSSIVPLFATCDLAPGTVVCDIGYPKTIRATTTASDVFVFSGGLAEFPEDLNLQRYCELPTSKQLFGCFTEGIVIAADPVNEAIAAFQGAANLDRARLSLAAATKLGIAPARVPQ
jgi:fatty aldehyde-generating acyl-ACP reductase